MAARLKENPFALMITSRMLSIPAGGLTALLHRNIPTLVVSYGTHFGDCSTVCLKGLITALIWMRVAYTFTATLLDPLNFPHRADRSVDDAINLALHSILQHLDSPGTYAKILHVDLQLCVQYNPASSAPRCSCLSSLCKEPMTFL